MELITSPFIRLVKSRKDGIFILDYYTNEIVYLEKKLFLLLKFCRDGKSLNNIKNNFSDVYIQKALDSCFLFERATVWEKHNIQRVEIETINKCNWRCRYCPQHQVERKLRIMPMELFINLIDQCKQYQSDRGIEVVALHHYNEPTIDPYFIKRISELKKRNMRLELFTNGKELSKEYILYLKQSKIVNKIVFHFPSQDEKEFRYWTGTDTYSQSKKAIETCCEYDLPVFVSTVSHAEFDNLSSLKEMFPKAACIIIEAQDRAGTIKDNEFNFGIQINDPSLFGCFYFIQILYVDVFGNIIPCINDNLEKKYIYGNINDKKIDDILCSPRAIELRKTIFGCLRAGVDFRCRKCTFMQSNKMKYKDLWKIEF